MGKLRSRAGEVLQSRATKILTGLLALVIAQPLAQAQGGSSAIAPVEGEHLGTVSFPVSCIDSVRTPFIRGVALLHDFWYQEAQRQFEQIALADPACAMAHWGRAMSLWHQIWERPNEAVRAQGWRELQAAQAHPAKTAREREYIAALNAFFRPSAKDYESRVDDYAHAMGKLHQDYPGDVDAAAFYALSLLAATAPDDASLTDERQALALMQPLLVKYPDHPGLVHYTIHACDTPSLAAEGLSAARHYGTIAASAPHAVHMPGHIFSRLGLWQEDIDSNLASVAASQAAEARHQSGAMDQFHSDDFLLYAYLQSGQDARAEGILEDSAASISRFESMHDMGEHYMSGMFPYYRTKFPVIFDLEMRDWKAAAALEPIAGASPEISTTTYWARTIAAGHLHQPQTARAALAEYDALVEQIKKGNNAYMADSTGAKIERGEMLAWVAFAEGSNEEAIKAIRASADLQDKVGQGEVDIPAREMLADMLLELKRPAQALDEYGRALGLSPNRFNGLLNAGLAAEAVGDKPQAEHYFAALLKSTDGGAQSSRPELDHVKNFMTSAQLAGQ